MSATGAKVIDLFEALKKSLEKSLEELPKCHCLTPITFEKGFERVTCWCPSCKSRAERDDEGHTVFVYGHGKTNEAAFGDWLSAMRRF